MSPPTTGERLAAIAALSGSGALPLPPPGPERVAFAAELVGRARATPGVTWAAIGTATGWGGPKAAKHQARRLGAALATGKPHELGAD